MARTPGPRGADASVPVEASTTQPTEAPAESTVADGQAVEAPQTGAQPVTTESGEQGTATPAPQQPAQAAKPEKSDDLTVFKGAVGAVYESVKDLADGEVVVVSDELMAPVTTEYRNLGTKGRAEARKSLNDDMRAYLQNREVPKAQAAVKMSDALTQGAANKTPKAAPEPVDPTEAFVGRAFAYDLAKRLVLENVPEGVADDWAGRAAKMREDLADQVKAYQEWLTARGATKDGEEAPAKPEGIHPAVEVGFRLAQGRAAGSGKVKASSKSAASFDGPRRSVKEHILEAFDNEPVGAFLKVSDLQKFESRVYGTDKPSSGAISSALESKNLPASLELGTKDGHKGAFKRAERAAS